MLQQNTTPVLPLLPVLIAPGLLGGCGVAPSKDLPPPESALTSQFLTPKAVQLEKLWFNFATELGLSYRSPFSNLEGAAGSSGAAISQRIPKSLAELNTELGEFPALLNDDRQQDLTTDLVKAFTQVPSSDEIATSSTSVASPFNETRCARIESVTELTGITSAASSGTPPPEGVKIFKFQYVLQSDSPTKSLGLLDGSFGDQVVRTALVSVPSAESLTGQKIPLVMYGHGGDSGLSYSELVRVFGDRQKTLVIAAPAFPNEPICEWGLNPLTLACNGQTIAKPAGVLKPFDTDANEILGLHHCLVRALLGVSSNSAAKSFGLPTAITAGPRTTTSTSESDPPVDPTFSALLSATLSTYGSASSSLRISTPSTRATTAESLRSEHPRSLVVGASRGAATGLIALAKSAAAYRAFGSATEAKSLSLFQCGAFLFPPTTFAMGKLRIGLELFVKGLAESSVFYQLPTAPLLAEFFRDYREGNATAEKIALKYMQIDPLLNIHLIASALRNWSRPDAAPGKLLLLHGRQDRVVGAENSRYFGKMISTAAARVSQAKQAPGVITSVVSFAPPANRPYPTGSVFGDFVYQHGDPVFQNSLSVPDTTTATQLNPATGAPEEVAWNLTSESKNPDFLDTERMNTAGKSPDETLSSWLTDSCLQH